VLEKQLVKLIAEDGNIFPADIVQVAFSEKQELKITAFMQFVNMFGINVLELQELNALEKLLAFVQL